MPETRTVHFTLAPALRAYFAYLDKKGLAFSLEGYDLFRANYRDQDERRAAHRRADDDGREGAER